MGGSGKRVERWENNAFWWENNDHCALPAEREGERGREGGGGLKGVRERVGGGVGGKFVTSHG